MVLAIVLKNRKKKRKKKKRMFFTSSNKVFYLSPLNPQKTKGYVGVFVDLFFPVELAISLVDLCSMQQSFCVFVQEDYLLKRG